VELTDAELQHVEDHWRVGTPFAVELALNVGLKFAVDELEAELIREALNQTKWNRKRAAALLHMPRSTLLSKIAEHHIDPVELLL
jgi:DNA-binding NtrC family response regulator